MSNSLLAQSHYNPIRANNILNQVLLEQQLLQERQQRSHHRNQQFVPSIEQLTQAKFHQSLLQERQRDLFQKLSQAQHGQMQPLNHQILLQEQLQARQLSRGLRPSVIREEERHMNSVWAGNENEQFLRNLASNQRAHASGLGQADFYQRQQRSSLQDQLNVLDRNHSVQDKLRQGLYEAGSVPFEQSPSFPAGACGINMDAVDARVGAQGLDMQDLSTRMQSGSQVGGFSSMRHNPHDSLTSNLYHGSSLDRIEGHWPNGNGQQGNDWAKFQNHQIHINSEQHKWESETEVTSDADITMWMSDGLNDDDRARQLLMDLLHRKGGPQPITLTDMKDGVSIDKRGPTGPYSIPKSSDHSFGVVPEQESGPNSKFSVGSCNSIVGEPVNLGLNEEQAINVEIKEKLNFRSESGVLFGVPSTVSGINEVAEVAITNSNIVDTSDVNHEYLEVEGRRPRSKGLELTMGSATETANVTAGHVTSSADHGEMSVQSLARSSSVDFAGGVQVNNGADSTMPGNPRFGRVSSCSDNDVSEPTFIDMLKSGGVKKNIATDVQPQSGASNPMDGRSGKKKGKKGRQVNPALLGFTVSSNRMMMGEIQRIGD